MVVAILAALATFATPQASDGAAKPEAAPPAAAAPADKKTDGVGKVVCQKTAPLGSRLPRTSCRLRSDVDRRQREDRDIAERIQSQPQFIRGN